MEDEHEHPTLDGLPKQIIQRLKGVDIGTLADDVLALHPKSKMAKMPKIVGESSSGEIVRWTYYGFNIDFERMASVDGKIASAYAVSKIEVNDERRSSGSGRKGRNTHRSNSKGRRKRSR